MAAFADVRSVLTAGNRSEELGKQLVSAELLPMLGVQPLRGRLFTGADDQPGAPNVEILSYRAWQSWFGGDEGIVGRQVQINSTPATIVGVLPPGFYFRNREIDLWEPLGLNPAQDYRKSQGRWMLCLARLKQGVTLPTAQRFLSCFVKRDSSKGFGIRLRISTRWRWLPIRLTRRGQHVSWWTGGTAARRRAYGLSNIGK